MAQISVETYRKIFVGVILAIIATILIVFGASLFFKERVDISINSVPEGASVEFRGKTYKTPTKLKDIKDGSYSVKFSKEGYFERKEKIKVSKTSNKFVFRLYTVDTSPRAVGADLLAAKEVNQSDFEKLLQYLPYKTANFRIEYKLVGNEPVIFISLYARLTKTSQLEKFKKGLKEYGEESLKWIRSKEVDPGNLTIKWFPSNPF